MVDWNEDGKLDLIIGDYYGKVSYYRNIGLPSAPILTFDSFLTVGGVDIDVYNNAYPWVDDWDEDGRKDLLVGSSEGQVYLFMNEGTNEDPVFNQTDFVTLASGEILHPAGRSAPVVVDLDGDGLKDIVTGDINGTPKFYRNDGSNSEPRLADYVSLQTGDVVIGMDATSRFAVLDWDQDGDMDLLGGSFDARLKLFLQTASTLPAADIGFPTWDPWIIPTSGGEVTFTLELENPNSQPVTWDVWTEVLLPDFSYFGPILSRQNITLAANSQISRDFIQNVPSWTQNGLYTYKGYIGNLADLQIVDANEFYFHKMDIAGGAPTQNWDCTEINDTATKPPDLMTSAVIEASPNPFNSRVSIALSLPVSKVVDLAVYNLAGQRVANLCTGFLPSGEHILSWDAHSFSSGMYLVCLKVDGTVQIEKITSLK